MFSLRSICLPASHLFLGQHSLLRSFTHSPIHPLSSLILCPVDFSAASAGVVACAAALAAATGARLQLLHVSAPADRAAGRAPGPGFEQLEVLRVAAELAGAARVGTGLVAGDAAPTILAEARRLQAGTIVIGAHGCTGISRFLMGSTAEAVLRHAPCTTLLVRAAGGASPGALNS